MTTTVSAAVAEEANLPMLHRPSETKNGRLRVMCRYGGDIVSLPQTKSLHYVGGDTRIVAVPAMAAMSFASLVNHLSISLGISHSFKVKYQLHDYGLDSLISMETDEDLKIMMEEHGGLSSDPSPSQSRIRLFLFPVKEKENKGGPSLNDPVQSKTAAADINWFGIGESEPSRCRLSQPETWFVDALRSGEMIQSEGKNSSGVGSGDGKGRLCGQESIVLETNSSFGSTSSSGSLTNLPPIKSSGQDNMADLLVKSAPTESMASQNGVVIASSRELPTHPHVPANKAACLFNQQGMSQPVPVTVMYPQQSPLMSQAMHQQFQVMYPRPHYIVQYPSSMYHQFPPPQPYPIYYVPIEQPRQPNPSQPQTGFKETQTPLRAQQVSAEATRIDVEEDAACAAQMYKT